MYRARFLEVAGLIFSPAVFQKQQKSGYKACTVHRNDHKCLIAANKHSSKQRGTDIALLRVVITFLSEMVRTGKSYTP